MAPLLDKNEVPDVLIDEAARTDRFSTEIKPDQSFPKPDSRAECHLYALSVYPRERTFGEMQGLRAGRGYHGRSGSCGV